MVNRRFAFTIIELIFVIVIIGILGAIAIPRFVGVSTEAHVASCTSAIATMNRTVGLNWWSESLSDGKGGNVTSYINESSMLKNLPDYNSTDCGVIVDLNVGDPASDDGVYGSPAIFKRGNVTDAPKWQWIRK